MKTTLRRLLPILLGAAGFVLRLLQQAVFEPDTALAVSGAPISMAMALYLSAASRPVTFCSWRWALLSWPPRRACSSPWPAGAGGTAAAGF